MKQFRDSGRRAFITGTCVAGIGAAFVTNSLANQSPVEECKGSIADALLLFDEILLEVQNDALYRAAQPSLRAARKCADALELANRLIAALQKEICKSKSAGTARRMEELVEAGSSNAKLLKASFSSASDDEIALMVGTIGTITKQIHEAATEVETDCKFVLTINGEKILKEIFATVEDARLIVIEVREAQKKYKPEIDLILCRVKAVQRNMFAAAIAIAKLDITALDTHVKEAICFLRKLDDSAHDPGLTQSSAGTGNLPSPTPKPFKPIKPKPADSTMTHDAPQCSNDLSTCKPDYNPPPPGKPAEVLIGLLRGTQVVAKNPAAGHFEVSGNSSDYDQSSFVAAADPRLVIFPAPRHVGDLLEAYCKPYTYVRRAVLTTAVGIARAAHPPGAERLRDIKWIVYKMKCDEPAYRLLLAEALAA